MKNLTFLLFMFLVFQDCIAQNVAINSTGALPDSSAVLDLSSVNGGFLLPRMTGAQRDSLRNPATALQLYNSTTNALNVYGNSGWQTIATTKATNNLVYVYALSDLPAPSGGTITLDATKMYMFVGMVNISPYSLTINGAGLRGTDPGKDGVISAVSGAILRSTGTSVFIADLAVIPLSAATKAYDFVDATGTKFCNIFSGSSVVEVGIPSLGVGQVSGFKAITIEKNYWNCSDGIKITGNVGKFAAVLNFITGINNGAGIEFLSGLVINDIDLSNNYFIYSGQTGVKVNAGALIDRGRMTTNMFRGVTTFLDGFDSYTSGWQMISNTDIPNTRAFCFSYMSGNTTATALPTANTFYKIAGTSSIVNQKQFSASSNKMTYTGKISITGKVQVIIGAKAPATNSDFSIVIAKNGAVINAPFASMAAAANNQSFQISFITEVNLVTNDYIEVFIQSNNSNVTSLVIPEMQFRIND